MTDPNPWSGELRFISRWLSRLQRYAHENGQSEIGVVIEGAVGDIDIAAETPMSDPYGGILSEREEP